MLLDFELFLPDRGRLGVGDHFVHQLHVVELLLRGFDGLTLDFVLVVEFLSFDVGDGQVLFLLLLELEHLLLLGLGESEFVLLLLLGHLLLEFLLLLGGFADGFLR